MSAQGRARSPDRQHQAAVEAVTEVQPANGPSGELRVRRQTDLGQSHIVRDQFLEGGRVRLEGQELARPDLLNRVVRPLHDQTVAGPQDELGVRGQLGLPLAHHAHHVETEGSFDPALAQTLPDERRIRLDVQCEESVAEPVDLVQLDPLSARLAGEIARWEEPPADERHIECSGEHHRHADRREVEHLERREPRLFQRRGDDDVRRRSDKGREAAEQRAERQRYEELRWRGPGPPSHVHDDGQQQGRHADVVHEGGEERGDEHDHRDEPHLARARQSKHLTPQNPGYAGPRQPPAQDEDRPDGDDRRVAEPGDGLLRRDEPGQGQRHHDHEGDDIDADPFGHEQSHRDDEDAEDERDVERHSVKVSRTQSTDVASSYVIHDARAHRSHPGVARRNRPVRLRGGRGGGRLDPRGRGADRCDLGECDPDDRGSAGGVAPHRDDRGGGKR